MSRVLVDICDGQGDVMEPQWLERAEPVHRQLRPALPPGYAQRMNEVFANGAGMSVIAENGKVLGVAVWRIIENTYEGRRLYVDDLVTDETRRSGGLGKALLTHLEQKARTIGCQVLALDSGVQRDQAHRFYFREGFVVRSFTFKKNLI